MIIDYNFFGVDFHGNIFDTAIPTAEIDELKMGAGIWDEVFVSIDTKIDSKEEKPKTWQLKTIMDAKFEKNLEAGSLGADGHVVTKIQQYRRNINGDGKWVLIGVFDYDEDYNVYSFLDRLVENEAVYEYAIVPVAGNILGDITVAEPIKVKYDGLFISDLQNNYKIEFDKNVDSISHNRNFAKFDVLNGRFPIPVFGNQNYRTGSMSFLPLTQQQIESNGMKIDARSEKTLQKNIVNFLTAKSAKVIRDSTGENMIVAVHDVSTKQREGALEDLSDISFSFTEIGEMDYETMSGSGLIGQAGKSRYTFDEDGEVVWGNGDMRSEYE